MIEAQHTDILLLSKLKKGNTKAFDALFRKYYPLLYTYGQKFVSMENAEEIAQDTMLWLWEHREEEIIQTSLVKYLLKAVYRRALNRIEQEKIKLLADTHYYHDIVENVLEEQDLCTINDLIHRLNEAIRNLPATYREAFLMHRFKGMTHKEIADHLDVSVQTVNYRIQSAVKLLVVELKDYLPLLLFLLKI